MFTIIVYIVVKIEVNDALLALRILIHKRVIMFINKINSTVIHTYIKKSMFNQNKLTLLKNQFLLMSN